MNIDKIFNKEINKKRIKMTLFFLILGIGLTIYALIRGLTDFDPKVFVLIASLVGLIISGFAIGGKLVQDINSGKKQQKILETTIGTLETATHNFAISQKIDTTTTKTNELSKLINENIDLLKEQNDKIKQQIQKNEEISKVQSEYLKIITKSISDSKNEATRKTHLEFEQLRSNLFSDIFFINSSFKVEFLKLNEEEKIKYLNRFKINLEGLIQHPYLKLNTDLLLMLRRHSLTFNIC